MRVIFWKGDAEGALKLGTELLTAAHRTLLLESGTAQVEAVALREDVAAAEEDLQRLIEEMEHRHGEKVSHLRSEADVLDKRGAELKAKAAGVLQALGLLS